MKKTLALYWLLAISLIIQSCNKKEYAASEVDGHYGATKKSHSNTTISSNVGW